MSSIKYNPTSHFFVEHTKLGEVDINNAAADAFGPVENYLETKYRTTSFIRRNTAISDPVKVFAICDGRVLIQPVTDAPDKVNLILKPETNYYAPLKIKYFIYRGIRKVDLIANDNIIFVGDSNVTQPQPEFLEKLWETFESYNASIPNAPPLYFFPANLIGYNPSDSQETLIDEIFNRYESATNQLPCACVGMHLGYFTDRIGLDIVLDDGDYQLEQQELFKFNLEYARKSDHVFDTTTINNPTNNPVIIKRYREYILRFLDAAAFWGSHMDCGAINLENNVRLQDVSDIYTHILNKYQTKDKVYIHIMEEKGRSYSYYDEDDNVSNPNNKRKVYFGLSDNPSVGYNKTNGWPILIQKYDSQEIDTTIYGCLDYKIDNSIHQIERFIAINVFAPSNLNSQKFLKKIKPNIVEGNGKHRFLTCAFAQGGNVCASFIFINCNFKQKLPLISDNYVNEYFNELWPANIKRTFAVNDNFSSWCTYDRNRIINLDEILSTGAIIQNKVFFDTVGTNIKRRLYVAALKENTTNNVEYNNLNIGNFTSGFKQLADSEYIQYLYNDNDFSVYKGSCYDMEIIEDVDTLTLFHDKNVLKRKSFFQLGIAEEEYITLITDLLTEKEDADNIFFYLEETPFLKPSGSETVRKFKLGLSYENNEKTIVTYFPSAVFYVYTIDGCYFFSKKYSDYQPQSFYTEFADAKVEFRPLPNDCDFSYRDLCIPKYDGEFGFDWLRIADNTNTNNDPTYSSIIVNGYKRLKVASESTEYAGRAQDKAFKALKQQYFSLPYSVRIGASDVYYTIPYLSLFSEKFKIESSCNLPYEANLRVLVSNSTSNRLEFDYDNSLFDIEIYNSDAQKDILGNKIDTNLDQVIKITCLKDFAESQLIKVWAYPAGVTDKKQAKLAGAILVNKNYDIPKKHVKFVYVTVKTDVDGVGGNPPVTGAELYDEKTNLKNALYHSLVMADIEDSPQLDLSSNLDYKAQSAGGNGKFIDSNLRLKREAPNLFQNLKTLFLNDPNNSKYTNGYFFVFVFGIEADNPDVAGRIERIGVRNMILFPIRGDRTFAHEAMHGFDLRHTHRDETPISDPNQLFIYPIRTTDNYMSYAGALRKATWRWQWDIIRTNIR